MGSEKYLMIILFADHFDGLAQAWGNSIVNVLKLPNPCGKPAIYSEPPILRAANYAPQIIIFVIQKHNLTAF